MADFSVDEKTCFGAIHDDQDRGCGKEKSACVVEVMTWLGLTKRKKEVDLGAKTSRVSSHREAFSASAGAGDVGVVEDKFRRQLGLHVVHFCAQ